MMSFGHFAWSAGFAPDPDAADATFTLRNTQSLSGWRPILAYIVEQQKKFDMSRSARAPRRRGQKSHMFKVG
jgi:hypothetical protein